MSEPEDGERFKDLWAWADQYDDEDEIPPVAARHVTAVLVAVDAQGWLPNTLSRLAASSQRPGRIVAVDAGSRDGTSALLAQARSSGVVDEVVSLGRVAFGEAVSSVLTGKEPWLWLLHDDSAPEPDAFQELLRVASTADVVFPKLLEPRRRNYPDIIAECGQSVSRTGFRVGIPEEGEIDQHQLEPGAVLGGSTAGMLVRGESWRQLGGLAPELPAHRDGVDFGWRANVAGLRVVSAPAGALVHRQASRTFERETELHPHLSDRLAALRMVGARGTGMLLLMLSTWLRVIGFLLAKSPSYARAELRAFSQYRSTRELTRSLAARIPQGDARLVSDLLAPRFWVVRHLLETLFGSFTDRWREFYTDTTLDDLTSDEYGTAAARRRRTISLVTVLWLLFALSGLAAGWRLWGATEVAGGGLLPAPDSLGALWQEYLVTGMPAQAVGAVLGVVTFGHLGLLSYALLLLGPLFAALSAHSLLKRLGLTAFSAAAGAGLWAGTVLVSGLPAAGDVSGLVFAIALPVVVGSGYAIHTDGLSGAEGLRKPAVGAFWLFILAAFWPPALLIATVSAIVVFGLLRTHWIRWVLLVAPVWLLFLPWLPTLFRSPARLLTGVDPFAWPAFPPASYALFVGRIFPAGIPVWLSIAFFAGVGVVALWSLLRIAQPWARWCVATAIGVPLLLGVFLSRLALPLGGGEVRALLSPWVLLAVAGAVTGLVVLRRQHHDQTEKLPNISVVAAVVAVLAALVWPVVAFSGQVKAAEPQLPRYVSSVINSPRNSRALLVEKARGRLTWNVVSANDPQWGSGETRPEYSAEFEQLVQVFTGGPVPDDLAAQLSAMGVSHVWLSGFTEDELLVVANAEGLSSAPAGDEATVFTVVGIVSRAVIEQPGQDPVPIADGVVPEGGPDRVLRISQSDVVASVAGEDLVWNAETGTFELGERAGELNYSAARSTLGAWWTLVLLAVLAVFALPSMNQNSGARRAGEEL